MSKRITVTPKLRLQHVNISRPDRLYKNYKTQGYFKDKEAAQTIVDILKEIAEDEGETGKINFKKTQRKTGDSRMHIGGLALPIYRDTDDQLYVEVKSNYAPKLFDVGGNAYPEEDIPMVGAGSTAKLKVQFKYGTKNNNITGYLLEAQIIGLKDYRGGGWGDASDEVEEGEIASVAPEERRFNDGRGDLDEDDADTVDASGDEDDDTDW